MLKESALRALKTLLPKGQVFTDSAALVAYEADAGMDKGRPEGVIFPRNTAEVMRLVRWAAEYRVPLIARGAGTGLSGGAVADRGGVIVEFSHMNRILDIDVQGRSAVVEPALINLRLDEQVKPHGLYFPPDPSSQRASTMGGNVAENSGGPHCFKYGVTTNYVTGLDVVLADGRRVRVGGRARDYPEYDLCGLITGSEGMLCLITSITVRLVRNPPGVMTLLAVFDSLEQAGEAVSAVISAGLVPATMEMMDRQCVGIVEPFARAGLPLDAEAILIIEVDGYPESLDVQMDEVMRVLQKHGAYGLRIARDEEERYKIWLARKSVAGAVAYISLGGNYTVDITVPRSRLAEILSEVNQICSRHDLRVAHVFHAGDGNLHPLILITEPDNPEFLKRVHAASYELIQCCADMGGSLTGEHGVGIEKRQFMPLMHNKAELMALWDVKQTFDPNNILNPGKIFPPPTRHESGPFAGYTLQHHKHNDKPASLQLSQEAELFTFTPTTAEVAAQSLSAFASVGRKVVITGGTCPPGTTRNAAQILSTSALRGVKTYAPDDLYITVGAGTPLKDVQSFLAQDGKQLAVASPWSDATVGGLVAANVNAPLRMRYGSLRDLVLCATVALTDGRVIRTGRPIVKNVAGYDLTKVFVGSYGTLGLLTDISFKISTQPRMRRTLLIPVDDLRYALIWARQVLPVALIASAIVLCKGYSAAGVLDSRYLLAYTAEGVSEDVQAELAQVRQILREAGTHEVFENEVITGTDIWAEVLGRNKTANPMVTLRIGVPVRELPAYMQDQAALLNDGSFIADISNGLIYATRPAGSAEETRVWLETLRKIALATEGYAVVMDTPATLEGQLNRWGYRPSGLDIMKRLKARWDPHGILNPGVFLPDL